MPINPSEAPPEAVAEMMRTFGRRAVGSTFMTSNLRLADPNTLSHSTPHRVAFLPLDEIRPGRSLRDMTQAGGWRFLIHGPDKAIAAARVTMKDAQTYVLGEISEGPFVAGTEEAIADAERRGLVDQGNFEVVLLVAPDLHVVALWLQGKGGAADIFMPLAPAPSGLTANQATPPDVFVNRLRELAEKMR